MIALYGTAFIYGKIIDFYYGQTPKKIPPSNIINNWVFNFLNFLTKKIWVNYHLPHCKYN